MLAVMRATGPPAIQGALAQTMGRHIALLVVHTAFPASSDEARSLVRHIRATHPPGEARVLVTGHTAFDLDFLALVRAHAPRAVALIVVATYVVLFMLLGSILLPAKAVVMNFLSISASYGALVWIFQDGHLARWLHFTPGPIETATPLVMFCVIFGLSMDYGVLLLSRIREEYLRTGDNTLAVGVGLERTGRLITARRRHHGRHLLRLRHGRPRGDQGHRHRHGVRRRPGRHDRPRAPGPRDDAPARPVELVGAAALARWHARVRRR